MRKPTIEILAFAALALLASACGGGASANTATVAIHFSNFEPAVVTAVAGEPITITLDNQDPIEHEWLVGDAAFHDRHRTGTEPFHDEGRTEVTIPSLSTRVTTVTFAEPGDYRFICHLPGHEAYGMVGTIRVTES